MKQKIVRVPHCPTCGAEDLTARYVTHSEYPIERVMAHNMNIDEKHVEIDESELVDIACLACGEAWNSIEELYKAIHNATKKT